LADVGIYELFGKGWEVEFEKIVKTIPGLYNLRQYEDFSNPKFDNMEKSKVFEGHFPHGSSVRALAHYSQIFNNKKFAYYDYSDKNENLKKYGQDTPPEIFIENIKETPIAMFVATEDVIVSAEDNRKIKNQI
jgi:hypothetical protein